MSRNIGENGSGSVLVSEPPSAPVSAALTFADLKRTHPAAEVRAWALSRDIPVAPSGGLPRFVYELYASHASRAAG